MSLGQNLISLASFYKFMVSAFSRTASFTSGFGGPGFDSTSLEICGQCYKTFFRRNYVAIGVTTVNIIGKYAASGVNYALKSFIKLATVANFIQLFHISFSL